MVVMYIGIAVTVLELLGLTPLLKPYTDRFHESLSDFMDNISSAFFDNLFYSFSAAFFCIMIIFTRIPGISEPLTKVVLNFIEPGIVNTVVFFSILTVIVLVATAIIFTILRIFVWLLGLHPAGLIGSIGAMVAIYGGLTGS